ncbi:TetR family transcriptional regulator [Actinopolyspora mortivallis]|uniref:TetR/AcrR family transcriptional regulator n=1 Tax=Actinopolyspora mortivallis TaxID=33906 RepID=UPI00037A2402
MSSVRHEDHRSTGGNRRRGRRAGGDETRRALLTAARTAFAENGYDGATVRDIARRAGVDPAMVRHWFGGKERLFTAAVSLPLEPARLLPDLLDGPRERLGERVLGTFLRTWDEAGGGEFTALVRSVSDREEAGRMLREFLTSTLLEPLLRELRADRTGLRAALCASQLVGLGMIRYVIRLSPLDEADVETVTRTMAPTVQHYLTGDLENR